VRADGLTKDESILLFLALCEANVWIRGNSLLREGDLWEERRKANLRLMAKISDGQGMLGESPKYEQIAEGYEQFRPSHADLERVRARLAAIKQQLQAVAEDYGLGEDLEVREPLSQAVERLGDSLEAISRAVLVSLGRAAVAAAEGKASGKRPGGLEEGLGGWRGGAPMGADNSRKGATDGQGQGRGGDR
jgi:hypothetical protein